MTSRDFCYWLQGYFEVSKSAKLTEDQTDMVKRHLALVFKHEIDPSMGGDQKELQKIHDGKPKRRRSKPRAGDVSTQDPMMVRC